MVPGFGEGSPDVIDRAGRDGLAALIRRFLGEEVGAFEVADALRAFDDSPDAVVRYVTMAMVLYTDDADEDGGLFLRKGEWDHFQRLLLLLASNCRLVNEPIRWSWAAWQLTPLSALAKLGVLAWQLGPGVHWLWLPAAFGAAAAGCQTIYERRTRYSGAVEPFASTAQIRTVYGQVDFRKACYPRRFRRNFRGWVRGSSNDLPEMCLFWAIFGPLILACLAFPERCGGVRVVVP